MSDVSINHLPLTISIMRIEEWRDEIDAIDQELLALLNRRAKAAIQIGLLKRAAGLPICDPHRECEVLTAVQAANNGPLTAKAVAELFRCIIRETKQAETWHSQPAKCRAAQEAQA